MHKCSDTCYPMCDFCKHFKENESRNFFGFCEIINGEKRYSDVCKWFYCFKQAEIDDKETE